MKKSIKRIAFLLAVVLIITGIPANNFSEKVNAEEKKLLIYSGEQRADSLLLKEDETCILQASGLSGKLQYKWQILIPGTTGKWADVSGMVSDTCRVSYALTASLLDDGNKAVLRCVAVSGKQRYISNPVSVTFYQEEVSQTVEAGLRRPVMQNPRRNESFTERKEYVTVTIHYRLESEDGVKIFADYIASLQYGSTFSATVASPVYAGYEPYILIDGVESEARSVGLSYTDLQEDQEMIVVYKPAESPYQALYFLQNVSNDQYTENASLAIYGKAITGTYPREEVEKDIDGFTSLFHEPDAVAADGSTVFHCYYDRNYYLYQFDCDGGYGAEPVYARYETPLIVPEPTRIGYVFCGWDKQEADGTYDGMADELPDMIGLGNLSYRALWKEAQTSITIVYWKENPDDDRYNYWDSVEIPVTSGQVIKMEDITDPDSAIEVRPSQNVVSDSELSNYIFNEERTKQFLGKEGTVVEGDGSTIINIYYKRKNYSLRFYYARERNGVYSVVGGSTYGFSDLDTTDAGQMLANVPDGNWGRVDKPEFNEKGKKLIEEGVYTSGTEKHGNYTYYYFDLTARYGSSLKECWPVDVMENTRSYNGPNGDYAVFSAWNGGNHVKYSQEHTNKTIKGNYLRLDDTIIYSDKYRDTYEKDSEGNPIVRYLAFWENGANIGWSVPRKWTYEIYAEALPSELENPALADQFVEYGGKKYLLFDKYICCDDNDDKRPESQTPPGTSGYEEPPGKICRPDTLTQEEKKIYKSAHIASFFYDRKDYTLRLFNHGQYLRQTGKEVPYGRFLTYEVDEAIKEQAGGTLPYPGNLEPNSYEFAGWYTSPLFLEGTEVTEETTMQATPMTLYASWKPIAHQVTFSDTYDLMMNGTYKSNLTVEHGVRIATSDVPKPDDSSLGGGAAYTFTGWFYYDETGNKRAFSPEDMTVTTDLHLFAEWQSSQIVSYTVHYVDENGNKIADDLLGHTYAGTTKTFTAKSGEELYTEYQKGYYPVVNSSSILTANGTNEVTFTYVYKEYVNYTVRYVDKETGADMVPVQTKTEKTSASVITEQFLYFEGYISDAFYKRLVLTADDEKNEIIFYYRKDEANIYYAVKYMIEDLEKGYQEYSVIEKVGKIGDKVRGDLLGITGFRYNEELTRANNTTDVTVTRDGVSAQLKAGESRVLYVYYNRNRYKYSVKYVEYENPDHVLKEAEQKEAKYGEEIFYTAPENLEITDEQDRTTRYVRVSPAIQKFTIRDTQEQTLLVYYQAQLVTITYFAVSPSPGANFGKVTPSSELAASKGTISGAMPEAAEGYEFRGWYYDATCKKPVPAEWVDEKNGRRFKPGELYHSEEQRDEESDNIYYALFEPVKGAVTVEKTGVSREDQNQTFLFRITGIVEGDKDTASEYIHMTVAVTGNGSVTIQDLPIGKYMVEEQENWSWRYQTENGNTRKEIQVTTHDIQKVSFKNVKKDTTWLGGENCQDNRFAEISGSGR